MTGHRGFALLTVLWLLLLLTVLISTGLTPVLLALRAGENRVLLTRARWAALGCLELTRARFEAGRGQLSLDSIPLAPVVWCTAERLDPDERVNPNVGDSIGLGRLLADPVRVASLLDWIDADDTPRDAGAEAAWYAGRGRSLPRNAPILDPAELRLVRGLEEASVEQLEQLFTARSDGRVSANRAPAWALASVSLLTPSEAERIVDLRRPGQPFAAADQLVALGGIDLTLEEFAELTRRLSFTEAQHTFRFHGRARAGARVLHLTIVATLHEREGELTVAHLEVR
jgi:type II secretory pathway component PulK